MCKQSIRYAVAAAVVSGMLGGAMVQQLAAALAVRGEVRRAVAALETIAAPAPANAEIPANGEICGQW